MRVAPSRIYIANQSVGLALVHVPSQLQSRISFLGRPGGFLLTLRKFASKNVWLLTLEITGLSIFVLA